MTHYLILESRDPYESVDWKNMQQTAIDLKKNGNAVTIFLLQNGVLPARRGTKFEQHFAELKILGIDVFADFFSLQERGIKHIAKSVKKSSFDRLIQLCLTTNTKTIWH